MGFVEFLLSAVPRDHYRFLFVFRLLPFGCVLVVVVVVVVVVGVVVVVVFVVVVAFVPFVELIVLNDSYCRPP